MLTQPRDFDKVFQWIIDILTGKVEIESLVEKAIASAAEGRKSLMYVEFQANTQAAATIIGLGKEPDVPFLNMRNEVVSISATHYKLNLSAECLFVLTEEQVNNELYFYITGGDNPHLIVPPHVETYRMRVERGHDQRILTIHEKQKVPNLPDSEGFIRAYLGK